MTISLEQAELALDLQRKAVLNRQVGCEEAARQLEALARALLHLPPGRERNA